MKSLFNFFLFVCIVLIITSCSEPKQTFQISVTFGKAWAYSPHSNEILNWTGNLKIEGGSLDSLFKLTYGMIDWEKGYGGCSRENSKKLDKQQWITDIRPGSGRGLEGIRLFIKGDKNTIISIITQAGTAQFTLGNLIDKEYLEFPFGGYYSFQPISVFLGPDARPRMSQKAYSKQLALEHRSGTMLIPDDFTGQKANFMSAYCAAIQPQNIISADFITPVFGAISTNKIPVKLQIMAAEHKTPDEALETTSGWIDFVVSIGSYTEKVRHFFTFFRQAEKLFDIYLYVPQNAFVKGKTSISIANNDTSKTLLLHRTYINEPPVSHLDNVSKLPPLPAKPNLWVGYDLNTSTTQNLEVDSLISRMYKEQMGNYLLFRIEESNSATISDFTRWGNQVHQNNFSAGTTMGGDVAKTLSETIGTNFLGIHQHECSNLIYGWGDSEPKAARVNRSLPECEAAYSARMKSIKMLGQALPMCNLDYKSGVNFISSEFPTGHSTLMMAANRGGSYLYDKPFWGVHLANHVLRMPDDESTLRRNFLFIWQSWLYGARLIYDEESAVYGIHSTSYSWSDPMSFIRRKQMQELFHYGSAYPLGKELVKTGFLVGKYDCLVGGVQSSPEMEPTKVWGMFGPETDSWKFDTPERGWELLNIFMPGVWLYPVKQDVSKIRMFFGASPNGQVDLVTIDGDAEKLKKYDLLILPGWNTMTKANYDKLIDFANSGGHLILAVSQATNHITRDFLTKKEDFDFYNQGDLTSLCGITVDKVAPTVQSIRWKDGRRCTTPGLPGLNAHLDANTIVLAEGEKGQPILVEKILGKGRVWTLIAGEYWGAPALDSFREQLGDTLIKMHKNDFSITGDTKEIDYHVYELPDGSTRITFLNTDWTKAGNIKSIALQTGGQEFPVSVKEGFVTNILINNNLMINYFVPGSGAEIINSNENEVKLRFSGTGKQVFTLISEKALKYTDLTDESIKLKDNYLHIDFGPDWQDKIIRLTHK
jgi:hypothetical protein